MPVPISDGAPPILDVLATLEPTATVTAAPWTDNQVANLNRYQRAGMFHPFTCGRRNQHRDNPGILIAERDGWRCPADGCDYRQTWAHPFMTDPSEPLNRSMTKREQLLARLYEIADRAHPCLFHEDIHAHHTLDCLAARVTYLMNHHLGGQAARDAYAGEVEQRILDRLVRQHAPATTRRLNPALSK
jgi:hypothetical protein